MALSDDILLQMAQDLKDTVSIIKVIWDTINSIVGVLTGNSESSLDGINKRIGQMWSNLQQEVRDTQTMVVQVGKDLHNHLDASVTSINANIASVESSLYWQAQANALTINNKIDKVQTTLENVSTNLTSRLDEVVNKVQTRLDGILKDITTKLDAVEKELIASIDKQLSPLKDSIEKLRTDTNSRLDDIKTGIHEEALYLAKVSTENTLSILAGQKAIAEQLHQDTKDLSTNLRQGMDGIANTIAGGIIFAGVTVGAAIAAGATEQAAPELGMATSLAAIAGTLAKILAIGEAFAFVDFDPKSPELTTFIGDILGMISKAYFDVGQKTYEAFDRDTEG